MKRPAVSICVPVYNVEETLERCLKSLVTQTLRNIEIICVNDGSTDDSEAILEEYASKDNRIIIIEKENGGLPSARNAAIDRASGEYLGFVDSDDYVSSNMFKKLYETAKRKLAEVVICGAEIFPEEPRAEQWYYDALSPSYRYYESFDGDLLFSDQDTTPFLWRTLISRDLIERNSLRLDESVHLGEDKAFQAKVYPLANGICVIPDKLYNYCWYREGSMMEGEIRNISDKKGYMHARMVTSIAENSKFDIKTKVSFFRWAIPFLYGDYLAVSKKRRMETAKPLMDSLDKIGLKNAEYELDPWMKDELKYLRSQASIDSAEETDVSIILIAEGKDEKLIEKIREATNQDGINTEIIIVNNGLDIEIWKDLEKLLINDYRMRVYNTPNHYNYSQCIEAGARLAEGKYVHFMLEDGWYSDKNALRAWYEFSKAQDLNICGYPINAEIGSFIIRKYASNSSYSDDANSKNSLIGYELENLLFKSEFLKAQAESVQAASVLTGKLFVLRCIEKTEELGIIQRRCYESVKKWRQDWIATEKCEDILQGAVELVETALESHDYELISGVYNMIFSDPIRQIIINGTKMYLMRPEDEPDGKNSQYKTINALYHLMSVIPVKEFIERGYEVRDNAGSLLAEVMIERNHFLDWI